MFTGIIEATGTVVEVAEHGAQSQLTISTPGWGGDLQHGESIAVDGVCLTVAKHAGDAWVADVMRITRESTTLGAIAPGRRVNLERALRADARLGGHILQGHVDGTARLIAADAQAEWVDLTFEVPQDLVRYVVAKGSIAINGTSLTIASLEGQRLTVSLIPTTLAETTMGELAEGDLVNIEVDVIAKYVERMLGERE